MKRYWLGANDVRGVQVLSEGQNDVHAFGMHVILVGGRDAATGASEYFSAANDAQQDNDDRDDEQDVNQSAGGKRGDHAEEPEDDEDNCDGI